MVVGVNTPATKEKAGSKNTWFEVFFHINQPGVMDAKLLWDNGFLSYKEGYLGTLSWRV